ncbi:right-handed parallel beta-helix repeat-containing protein [Candidatus Poribacteria bacterium]
MRSVKIISILLLILGVLALAGFWVKQDANADPSEKVSPMVVDASGYSDLQTAIDAVPKTGGLLKLPPGDFELTHPLLITQENLRVEGSGAATHLINHNEDGEPAVVVRPENRSADQRSRIWRVQLADFRISGNPKSGDGLLAEGVNEIYIHGLSVDHNGAHGINLVDCYEDPRIADSIITYNGQAGLNILQGHDIVVNANQFEENLDAVRRADSFNLCMNGNNLDDHLRHGIVIENTYGSVVSGNMIEECKGTAIVLDRDCYGITVSANVIAHNSGGGVYLIDAWGCSISANTFTIVAQRALVIGPESGRITVTGNNFSNSYIGGQERRAETSSPATGILLESTSDVVVSGNIFTGLAQQAVEIEGECPRVLVDGNVFADLGREIEEKPAAFDYGKSGDLIIGDNAIQEGFELKSQEE